MRPIFSPRLLGPGLGLAMLACAGGDLNLPTDDTPVELTAVSGDGQEAKVGTRLPDPLVVRVTDAAGRPVAEVPLVFRFQDEVPDAEIDPASVATDSTGRASVRVRLGTTTGPQTIEATIAQDAAPQARATFGVTALEKHGHGGGDGGGDDD
ncbi:MAG TPA: Ig-like domain-containing protein [Gemmatimonadales bacterium]|nr:Ig-like domain-containing protein [Gemmatimonadales bacterium]